LVVSPTDQFNTKNGAILFATDITVAQACTMECLLTALLCVVWLSVNPPDGARYPDGTGLDGPGDEDPSKNHPSNNMLAPLAIGMTLLASVIAACAISSKI
jgi:glycerol uptake facilitator-like aquaporin